MQILVLPGGEFVLWEEHFQQIRQAAGDAEVRIVPFKEATPADCQAADVIFGAPKLPWLDDTPRLGWLQLPTAGADRYCGLRPDVLLSNASGSFGIPIAEWVLGTMVIFTRNLHLYRDQQHQRLWQERHGVGEVYGSTVGIVGLGDLGTQIGLRAKAFGCRVLGTRRRPTPCPDFLDALLPLDELIPQADFLVLTLPKTPATQTIINADRIARMKPGARLINVGRGAIVDEEALIAALRTGRIAGAALDVTAVEPLPPESPLWTMEQVIITPHVSARSPRANADRRTQIFCDNLHRYRTGEPLANLVNRQAGY